MACSAESDWDRLHLAGFHPDQVVPRPPRHGHGHGNHGVRRGAFIASPLSVWLMARFSSPTHVGVAEAFVVLGLVYAAFMLVGAAIVRVPAPGWQPQGYVAPAQPRSW